MKEAHDASVSFSYTRSNMAELELALTLIAATIIGLIAIRIIIYLVDQEIERGNKE